MVSMRFRRQNYFGHLYQSFNQVDQTLVQVDVEDYGNLPFRTTGNTGQPSDREFQTRTRPPLRRDVELAENTTTAALVPAGRYKYRTSSNKILLSLSAGLHAIGDVVFFPN